MDFADHGRDDHFKEYAARASAECLLSILRDLLPEGSSTDEVRCKPRPAILPPEDSPGPKNEASDRRGIGREPSRLAPREIQTIAAQSGFEASVADESREPTPGPTEEDLRALGRVGDGGEVGEGRQVSGGRALTQVNDDPGRLGRRRRLMALGLAGAITSIFLLRERVQVPRSSGDPLVLELRTSYDEMVIDAVPHQHHDQKWFAAAGYFDGDNENLHLRALRPDHAAYHVEADYIVPGTFADMREARLSSEDLDGDEIDELIWETRARGQCEWGAFVVSASPKMQGWILCDCGARSGWSGCRRSDDIHQVLALGILERLSAPDGVQVELGPAIEQWRQTNTSSAPFQVQAEPLDLRAMNLPHLVPEWPPGLHPSDGEGSLQRIGDTSYLTLAGRDDDEGRLLIELTCDPKLGIDSRKELHLTWAACTLTPEDAPCECLGDARVRYAYEGGDGPLILEHDGRLYFSERSDALSVLTPPDRLERHWIGEEDAVISRLRRRTDKIELCYHTWADGASEEELLDGGQDILRKTVVCGYKSPSTVEHCESFTPARRPLMPSYGAPANAIKKTYGFELDGCLFWSLGSLSLDTVLIEDSIQGNGDARFVLFLPSDGERCPVGIDTTTDPPRFIDWMGSRRSPREICEQRNGKSCVELSISWWEDPKRGHSEALVWSNLWEESIHASLEPESIMVRALAFRPSPHEGPLGETEREETSRLAYSTPEIAWGQLEALESDTDLTVFIRGAFPDGQPQSLDDVLSALDDLPQPLVQLTDLEGLDERSLSTIVGLVMSMPEEALRCDCGG